MKKFLNALSISLVVIVLAGCTTFTAPSPGDDPMYIPKIPQQSQQQRQTITGSLFNVNNAKLLYSDKLATQVGDLITIVLQEQTQASKNADTELKKDQSSSAEVPNILGKNMSFNSGGYDLSLGLESQRQFKAEADTAQSNQLTGTITVTVQEVLPNGNLVVSGEKWITLNQGDEYIRISGMIRPDDIDGKNTVVSSRVANARISYSGKGDLAENNLMGWVAKFFNSGLWLF